jgi:propionyl-CoA carboxylase alpha chain
MQEQCIALCKAVNYRSAGTIEMLADGKQNFFFLEMNTRLQVEHPITELVSGEDLVEHMLWIAAGKALPERLTRERCLSPKGWALESRVYAEDPLRNFLPTIGPLYTYKEPELMKPSDANGNVTVRIDTGVCEGATISMFYDPMISKLCTHAPTRDVAITAMEKALDEYFIHGLVNNIPFLRSVYRNHNFRSGNYGTGFIPAEYPKGFHGVELSKHETNQLIAAAVTLHTSREDMSRGENDSEYSEGAGYSDEFIVALPAPLSDNKGKGPKKASELEHAYRVQMVSAEEYQEIHITPLHGHHKTEIIKLTEVDWATEAPLAKFVFLEDGKKDQPSEVEAVVQYEGRASQLSHGAGIGSNAGEKYHLRIYGSQQQVVVRSLAEHALSKHMIAPEVKDTSKFLLCPMPGSLISISK